MTGLAVIIMGVSGAGKSTVGELLAKTWKCPFYDADGFHSEDNKEKMKNGVSLTDEDRMPWLETLRDLLIDHIIRDHRVVLACSALRPQYRDILRTADYGFLAEEKRPDSQTINGNPADNTGEGQGNVVCTTKNKDGREQRSASENPNSRVVFVYLKGTAELFAARLVVRHKAGIHYMPPVLLQSQIDTLQIDKAEMGILETDASLNTVTIVEDIQSKLSC